MRREGRPDIAPNHVNGTSKSRVGQPETVRKALGKIVLSVSREVYLELVCEGAARGYRALTRTHRSIHVGGAIHIESVEMQACALIAKLVVDVDHNTISHSSPDLGVRPLAVDTKGRTLKSTVRVGYNPGDIKIIGDNSATNERAEVQKKDGISCERVWLRRIHCKGALWNHTGHDNDVATSRDT